MTLLDTIPIYVTPWWFIVIMIFAGLGLFITLIEGKGTNKEGIFIGICLLVLVVGLILGICEIPKVYDHDEYVVELDNNTSATEFFKNYEITKTFEYSNAWQVKKKDGVK